MKSRKSSFRCASFLMFISLLLSISSIQASFLKEEQELLGEVTRSNIRKVLEKHTGENPDLLNSSKGQDIVVFLGKTGAGKSTLINYLSDKELKVDEDGNIVLKNPMDSSAMRIGIGGDSETFLPKFIKSNGLLFYDLAGFGDTRGTAISLVNACFIKNIIENAATARLVFVAGQDEITAGRGELFKQLTMITRDLIPNEIIERFSSLVITRSIPGRNKQQLINFLQTKTDPEILAPWIEQGRLVKMSSPFGEEIELNDRANILDAIFNTPPQKIKNINIGVIYSDKELNNLRKVYYGEIDDAIHGLIKNNFDSNTLSSLDRGTLENKKNYFQSNFLKDVFLSVDTSPLINLLRPISENIYHSSWDEMKNNISLTSDKIIGFIDVEIKDQEKREAEKRRAEEELKRIKVEQERKIAEDSKKVEEIKRKQVEEQLRQAEIRRLEEREAFYKKLAQIEEEKKYLQEAEYRRVQQEKEKIEAEKKRLEEQKIVKTSNGLSTEIVADINVYYKIKSLYNGNCLNSWAAEIGQGTATVQKDDGEAKTHRLWYFVKSELGDYYKIKNLYSGNCLDFWQPYAGMQNDIENEYKTHRLWYFIKSELGSYYKIKNLGIKNSDNCLNCLGDLISKKSVSLQPDIENEYKTHRLWYFIKSD